MGANSQTQIRDLAEFYQAHGVRHAALLKNNPLWLDKPARLGLAPSFDAADAVRHLYDPARFTMLADILSDRNVAVVA